MKGFIEQIYRNNKNYKGIVFLDRDGTLVRDVQYLRTISQLKILPTIDAGIRLLNKKNIAVVVVTNQPAVARGLISVDQLKKINDVLVEMLKNKDAYIDAVYSCPHHPERHHSDIPKHALKFRIVCECRKPGIAMHKKAMSNFGSKNVLGVIGNHARDINAGKRLSVPTVLLADDNFLDAVKKLF